MTRALLWLRSWLHQPTTIIGLAACGGAAVMAIQGEPNTSWLPVLVPGLIGMLMPDHSHAAATSAPATRLALDAAAALAGHNPKAVAALVGDVDTVIETQRITTKVAPLSES